jgi:hypothetical protein
MWKSPTLRGSTAKWEQAGPVFTSSATVLGDDDNTGHLVKEFVTIDFLGTMYGALGVGQEFALEECSCDSRRCWC